MKKYLDKLKGTIKVDKQLFLFLIILFLVGIIAGSFFVSILNHNDKELIITYLNQFLDTLQNNITDYVLILKNNISNTLLIIILIWLLGISIIGLPIIIILFFIKAFTLGFSIGSIIMVFKIKGILFALFYVFPGQVIELFMILILSMYAISFSLKLIYSIFKKKTIDFKIIMNRYLWVLFITLLVSVIAVLYDTYGMPFFIKQILFI